MVHEVNKQHVDVNNTIDMFCFVIDKSVIVTTNIAKNCQFKLLAVTYNFTRKNKRFTILINLHNEVKRTKTTYWWPQLLLCYKSKKYTIDFCKMFSQISNCNKSKLCFGASSFFPTNQGNCAQDIVLQRKRHKTVLKNILHNIYLSKNLISWNRNIRYVLFNRNVFVSWALFFGCSTFWLFCSPLSVIEVRCK